MHYTIDPTPYVFRAMRCMVCSKSLKVTGLIQDILVPDQMEHGVHIYPHIAKAHKACVV